MNAHLLKKWFYFRERLPAHRWSLGASNGLLVQSMLRCRTPAGGRWDTCSGLHFLLSDFAGTVRPKGSSFWQRLDVCYSGQMTWVQARFPRKERARCCPWDFPSVSFSLSFVCLRRPLRPKPPGGVADDLPTHKFASHLSHCLLPE